MELFFASWNFLLLSAPYLLTGLLISGLIHEFLGAEYIERKLKKNSLSNVIKAALIGIPLPLCSCSVIPTAVTLKKAGASNASTSSFLVATPESGVDSIAMTWGVMDLPMTIFRPIFAFLSAVATGTLQMLFNPHSPKSIKAESCSQCPSAKSGKSLKNIF
ncbi:MAG: permease, partial [Halobacteriovoraceae bacterium]|nr:permease [Halobacteriovoraceae bacterium]